MPLAPVAVDLPQSIRERGTPVLAGRESGSARIFDTYDRPRLRQPGLGGNRRGASLAASPAGDVLDAAAGGLGGLRDRRDHDRRGTLGALDRTPGVLVADLVLRLARMGTDRLRTSVAPPRFEQTNTLATSAPSRTPPSIIAFFAVDCESQADLRHSHAELQGHYGRLRPIAAVGSQR